MERRPSLLIKEQVKIVLKYLPDLKNLKCLKHTLPPRLWRNRWARTSLMGLQIDTKLTEGKCEQYLKHMDKQLQMHLLLDSCSSTLRRAGFKENENTSTQDKQH